MESKGDIEAWNDINSMADELNADEFTFVENWQASTKRKRSQSDESNSSSNSQPPKVLSVDQTISVLRIYKSIHGNVLILNDYVVPRDIRFPEYSWGYDLGIDVAGIKSELLFPEHADKWIELGLIQNTTTRIAQPTPHFRIKPVVAAQPTLVEQPKKIQKMQRPTTFDDIYSALVAYKALHGDFEMKITYIVPMDDPAFPLCAHGMALGQILYRIRKFDCHSKQKVKLTALGVYESQNA